MISGVSDHDETRERRVTLHRVRRGPDEADADAAFWMSLTPEQRVELLWDMALESLGRVQADGGEDDQSRLLRVLRRVRRA